MSAIPYRLALERDLTDAARALLQSLLDRAERIDALTEAVPGQIAANRERREGKPALLSRGEKATIRSFEADARKAARDLPPLIAGIPSEALLLRTFLETEQTERGMTAGFIETMHPEDAALYGAMETLRREIIGELEAFLAPPSTTP